MDNSIKGIVRRFINKLTELEDEPMNQQSIEKLSCLINEFEENIVSITHDLHQITVYEQAKQNYIRAINEIDSFME